MVKIGDGIKWTKKEERQIAQETLKIFISYSRSDWKKVERIVDVIDEYLSESSQLHDIWLDRWKMRGGKWFQDQMLSGLEESDYLILVASDSSIKSSAVQVEWKTKFREKISANDDTIFPLLIGDISFSDLPAYLQQIHGYRYKENKDTVIKLVEDILFWQAEKQNSN